jgi:IS30 family transposase
VKRYTKLYREKGPAGFYAERKRRGPAVLTREVLKQVQQMLDADITIPEIASTLGLLSNTVEKALRAGRLHRPLKKTKNG